MSRNEKSARRGRVPSIELDDAKKVEFQRKGQDFSSTVTQESGDSTTRNIR